MHLKRLPFEANPGGPGVWTVCAVANESGACQVEDFLSEHLAGPMAAQVGEMIAFLEQLVVDPEGPRRWEGTPRSHESVAGERIFEFIIGRLRVHWFYGRPRQVAILAVGVVKKSRTTPGPLAKQLKKLKVQYEADVEAGQIFYMG